MRRKMGDERGSFYRRSWEKSAAQRERINMHFFCFLFKICVFML
jgi:hypothetical protein